MLLYEIVCVDGKECTGNYKDVELKKANFNDIAIILNNKLHHYNNIIIGPIALWVISSCE